MDSITRTALVAALTARGIDARVSDQIRIVEDDSNSVRDLTPTNAEKLIAMFGGMIQKYSSPMLRAPTPRIVTAQRPFYERYRYAQHNGAQEMARRRKRIYSGRMSLSECIRSVNGVRYTADSHGVTCRFYS